MKKKVIISRYTKVKQSIFLIISLFVWSISLYLFFINDNLVVNFILLFISLIILFFNYYYSRIYDISVWEKHLYIENIYKRKRYFYTEIESDRSTGTIIIFSVFYCLSPPLFYLKVDNGQRIYFERNPKKNFDLLFPFNGKKVAKELSKDITNKLLNS